MRILCYDHLREQQHNRQIPNTFRFRNRCKVFLCPDPKGDARKMVLYLI